MTVDMETCLWEKIAMNIYLSPLWPSLDYKTFITQVAWSGINWLETRRNKELCFQGVNKYFGKRIGGLGA